MKKIFAALALFIAVQVGAQTNGASQDKQDKMKAKYEKQKLSLTEKEERLAKDREKLAALEQSLAGKQMAAKEAVAKASNSSGDYGMAASRVAKDASSNKAHRQAKRAAKRARKDGKAAGKAEDDVNSTTKQIEKLQKSVGKQERSIQSLKTKLADSPFAQGASQP